MFNIITLVQYYYFCKSLVIVNRMYLFCCIINFAHSASNESHYVLSIFVLLLFSDLSPMGSYRYVVYAGSGSSRSEPSPALKYIPSTPRCGNGVVER